MVFWSLAIVVTVIASAALYYAAAGRRVNAAPGANAPVIDHLKLALREIDSDSAVGRIGTAEATAARAEVAREAVRIKAIGEAASRPLSQRVFGAGAVALTAILALGTYAVLGRPDLPALPLATRPDAAIAGMDLEQAVARIEAQLKETPEDMRGWTVIAPVYMQMGRYDAAADAIRRIIAAEGPTADRETDLGEALMMDADGTVGPEALALYQSAAGRDASHIRSRYYLASEAMRTGDFAAAKARWSEMLALSAGGEPWLEAARQGLAGAEAGLSGAPAAAPASPEIAAMVEGLAARLAADGGSIAEWTQLVRSHLVLGQTDRAQQAYLAARAAYPEAGTRTELDVLAADNGLVVPN
jgi:cytochrome c-type biogenesis protein CcmH